MTNTTLKVKTISLSFYDLLDGCTPEEVKTNIDRILNDNIQSIREGCEVRFDVYPYGDDLELDLVITRKETQEEHLERTNRYKAAEELAKQNRHKEYLRLKAEFEGETNGS